MGLLLNAGADSSGWDSSWEYGTPLQLAAASGRGGAVALLLNAGVDVNVRNPFRLPLEGGGRPIGGFPRGIGVDEYFESGVGELCETALQAASANGFTAVVQQLLEAGANV